MSGIYGKSSTNSTHSFTFPSYYTTRFLEMLVCGFLVTFWFLAFHAMELLIILIMFLISYQLVYSSTVHYVLYIIYLL